MKKKYYKYAFNLDYNVLYSINSKNLCSRKFVSRCTLLGLNGKTIKFGSAIIAFSKIRQNNIKFDEKTIFLR